MWRINAEQGIRSMKWKVLLVAAATVALGSAQAHAGFIVSGLSCVNTTTTTGTCTQTVTAGNQSPLSGTFDLAYFDPSSPVFASGTSLTGVSLSMTPTSTLVNGSVRASSGAITSAVTNFTQTYNVSDSFASTGGNGDIYSWIGGHVSTTTTAIADSLGAIANGATANVSSTYLNVPQSSTWNMSFADLATWTSTSGGFDPVSFSAPANFSVTVTGASGYQSGGQYDNSLAATLTYTFAGQVIVPAPEPAAALVLLTGLLGLTAVRLRRRA